MAGIDNSILWKREQFMIERGIHLVHVGSRKIAAPASLHEEHVRREDLAVPMREDAVESMPGRVDDPYYFSPYLEIVAIVHRPVAFVGIGYVRNNWNPVLAIRLKSDDMVEVRVHDERECDSDPLVPGNVQHAPGIDGRIKDCPLHRLLVPDKIAEVRVIAALDLDDLK